MLTRTRHEAIVVYYIWMQQAVEEITYIIIFCLPIDKLIVRLVDEEFVLRNRV